VSISAGALPMRFPPAKQATPVARGSPINLCQYGLLRTVLLLVISSE
jgi:hypothetical protein